MGEVETTKARSASPVHGMVTDAAGLDGRRVLVADRPGGAGPHAQRQGQEHVDDEHRQKPAAGDPEERAQVLEELGVAVDRVRTGETPAGCRSGGR